VAGRLLVILLQFPHDERSDNGDNDWNKLTVSGWLDGVTIKIAYQESESDDWSIEEFIKESTNVGSIKNLKDGKYAIMVGCGSADFIKEAGSEPDYKITINLN
jgi:hypothetical protein